MIAVYGNDGPLSLYLVYIAESGRKKRSPRGNIGFSFGVEDERADAGRDGEPVSRDHFLCTCENRENYFSLFS